MRGKPVFGTEADVKRALFVDDDAESLSALQIALTAIRRDWDLVFVEGANNALDTVDAGPPFDVVVADLELAGIGGAELFRRIMSSSPQTIRFALSRSADARKAISASSITHQYLTKPFDPQLLHDLLVRAFALREHLANTQIAETLLKLGGLPTLPAVYREVMAEIHSPDPSVARVAEIVSRDVSISAKVLQVVNSAYIGLRNRVSSVAQAASLLGLDNLRNLVLMAEVFTPLHGGAFAKSVDIDALWAHSLTVGEFAMRIAQSEVEGHQTVYESFTAGLLHDIGLLIMASRLPDGLDKAFARARLGHVTLADAEREYTGVTHAEVGGFLLELWGLSDPIVEAVLYHLAPLGRPETFYSTAQPDTFSALTAVHTANVFSNNEAFGQLAVDADFLNALDLTAHLDGWWDLCHR